MTITQLRTVFQEFITQANKLIVTKDVIFKKKYEVLIPKLDSKISHDVTCIHSKNKLCIINVYAMRRQSMFYK